MAKEINFKHPLYNIHAHQLEKVNNIYSGVDTAKVYLQRYSQEDTSDFLDRQDIATLDNYVFSTIVDMKNIIFRKPLDAAKIQNKEMQEYAKRINFQDSLNEFSKEVLVNRLKEGYTFILADSTNYDPEEIINKEQQRALGIRPYLVNILRSNVLSWKINDKGEYTQIVIREYYEVELEFSSEIKEQIKIWYDFGMVEIYRDNEYHDMYETGLDMIPIIRIGDDETPPLYDMSKINVTHMNRNSEVDNYTRVGGAAFLAVFGDLGGDAPKTLGINKGLKFQSTMDSDVKWVEMEGTNYEMLKSRIKYHEEQMDRIAVSYTSEAQNKTATQVDKESMTGESKLTNYATELEEGINAGLALMNEYKTDGSLGENTISVNKDFDSSVLSTEMVKSYKEDYAQEIISYEKLIEILVAGEYFKAMDEKEMDTEKARIRDGE